ncbi:unnamed protein product [Angiostrongylus costaricensis]|uniref:Uncharacterized protein n=1 Tax=Angiostrongylus costaricensis TaxID=334426 RepID=A0A0R3PB21_ANGCS|nr:unnamed protein product [Angiostrongylus costaricensis]
MTKYCNNSKGDVALRAEITIIYKNNDNSSSDKISLVSSLGETVLRKDRGATRCALKQFDNHEQSFAIHKQPFAIFGESVDDDEPYNVGSVKRRTNGAGRAKTDEGILEKVG